MTLPERRDAERAAKRLADITAVAFGHGVTASILGKSEDEALRSWATVAAGAGWRLDEEGYRAVRNGWRLREACTWRTVAVGIREIAAENLRREDRRLWA